MTSGCVMPADKEVTNMGPKHVKGVTEVNKHIDKEKVQQCVGLEVDLKENTNGYLCD